jgi:hypothetical protein
VSHTLSQSYQDRPFPPSSSLIYFGDPSLPTPTRTVPISQRDLPICYTRPALITQRHTSPLCVIMDGPESKMPPQAPLLPPGSPLRAHESIWKRSKKILGMSRFAFLQQIDAQGPRGMSCSIYYYLVHYESLAFQPAGLSSISFCPAYHPVGSARSGLGLPVRRDASRRYCGPVPSSGALISDIESKINRLARQKLARGQ